MSKEHARCVSLREALAEHATEVVPELPRAAVGLDMTRLVQLEEVLKSRRAEIVDLKQMTLKTQSILRDMARYQRDTEKMEKLFKNLNRHKARIDGDLNEAFKIITALNTVGSFRRHRADHAIGHDASDDRYAKQRKQIDRDRENLDWIVQACDETLAILDQAAERTAGFLAQHAEAVAC